MDLALLKSCGAAVRTKPRASPRALGSSHKSIQSRGAAKQIQIDIVGRQTQFRLDRVATLPVLTRLLATQCQYPER